VGVPRVLLGTPYAKDFPGPFVASLAAVLEHNGRDYQVEVCLVPNTAVHAARTMLVKEALRRGADYLLMVDSDQCFAPEVVARLLRWRVPAVAPVIVARQGDPIPVAYAEEGRDLAGDVHYAHLADEVWAYLSQYFPARLRAHWAVLPLLPDHAPEQEDIPDAVRAGLQSPLLACDAVGTGMVLLRRDVLERVRPDAKGHYFDWANGGEDLSFFRRVREAGYRGFWIGHPPDDEGIYCDRGCVVGHLTYYARGAMDLAGWLLHRSQEPDLDGSRAEAGLLAAFAEEMAVDGARPTPGPWQSEPLPQTAGQ
jgi:hypothetical protein